MQNKLWKQTTLPLSLELTGQASDPRAAFLQARNPGDAAEAGLCSAQAWAAFPPAAEITLHFISYLRSYQANYPGRKPRAVPKAKVLCKACPGDTGRQMLYLATTDSIFCHSGNGRVTKTPAMVWKA